MKDKLIEVYADWDGLNAPTCVGYLHAAYSRGKEIFSFEYDDSWLKNQNMQPLDPSLQLLQGRHYAPRDFANFGAFLDSSPDRWGRFLMKRREAICAREEKRDERKLGETDFLLGVYDQHRLGALRFKLQTNGPFLDDNQKLATPPWASLRELEHASLSIEQSGSHQQKAYASWLNMLIAPGGSLGGARPKAGVVDEQKQLWIAKFPSLHDECDIGAWEMCVNKLAKNAGITVPDAQLKKLNNRFHTFLSKRFDRTKKQKRLHFASAMTLLQRHDGDDASTGTSYLELAELIIKFGAKPDTDLEQLWRRIVFNICVSNCDDHLRNHGFLLDPEHGWVLSPAYDMNPTPEGHGLKLNISDTDNSQNLALTKQVAPFFRLNEENADRIIDEVTNAVKQWQTVATQLKISSTEQDHMRRAFRLVGRSGQGTK
jgi:serine/threonine-protein kinase HipA